MMAQYLDLFTMTFSTHISNFMLLSQSARLLTKFLLCRPTIIHSIYMILQELEKLSQST